MVTNSVAPPRALSGSVERDDLAVPAAQLRRALADDLAVADEHRADVRLRVRQAERLVRESERPLEEVRHAGNRRRATKKPEVPCRCGSVSRNSGRVGWLNAGHSALEVLDLEPGGVDHRLALVGVQRADGVDDRAARLHALGRGAEERELQVGQRLRAPAEIGSAVEDAEAGARRVHERAVEALKLVRELEGVGVDDADVGRTESLDVPLELACAALVLLDGHDLAGQLRRLPAGRGAEVERPLSRPGSDGEPGELRAAALRPDPPFGQRLLVHARRRGTRRERPSPRRADRRGRGGRPSPAARSARA